MLFIPKQKYPLESLVSFVEHVGSNRLFLFTGIVDKSIVHDGKRYYRVLILLAQDGDTFDIVTNYGNEFEKMLLYRLIQEIFLKSLSYRFRNLQLGGEMGEIYIEEERLVLEH